MTTYELWLFLHIVGTVLWVGGAVVVQVFGVLTQRAADPAQSAAFGQNSAFVGTWVLMPASALVILSGAALAEDGNWDWGEPFILFGLVGWIVVAGIAFGYLSPSMKRVAATMATEGPSPVLLERVRNLVLLSRALILVLFVVVFMMVVKLGT